MKLALLLCLLFMKPLQIQGPGLTEVRSLFAQSATNKYSAEKLSILLSKVDTLSPPVLICYKGAAQMIRAKYILNPFNKLTNFNQGKTLIEAAVKKEPENLEIRFVRFSIQTNLPAFLGYNNDIIEDKKNLIANVNFVTDTVLRYNINNYLSGSKYCTEEEIKKLKE